MEILKQQEKGIIAIETAWLNGLRLVPAGDMVDIQPMKNDLDPEQVKLIKQMLKQNAGSIKAITKDAKGIRDTLCKAQETLSKDNSMFLVSLDLWDRLEKAYRAVFPNDSACINGEKGCLDEAIVRCKSCEGVKNGI
jgi:hypothetical protein